MAIQFSFSSDAGHSEPAADILLVQRDRRRVDLTLAVLDGHRLASRVHVVRDGLEALEYLFCSGAYADRFAENPRLVLIDLDVALADNLDALRQIKRDPLTSSIPITVLACSAEDRVRAMAVLHEHEVQVPVAVVDGTSRDERIAGLDLADEGAAALAAANAVATADRMLDDLGRSRELESLACIARGMAHEFNNLFSIVVAYTELLLKDLDADDPRRAGAEAIFKSIGHASKLARQMLTLSAEAARATTRGPTESSGPQPARRSGKAKLPSAH